MPLLCCDFLSPPHPFSVCRLKAHYASYEPMLRQLNEKYETLLRQKMLTSLEKDKVVGQVPPQSLMKRSEGGEASTPPSSVTLSWSVNQSRDAKGIQAVGFQSLWQATHILWMVSTVLGVRNENAPNVFFLLSSCSAHWLADHLAKFGSRKQHSYNDA